MPLIIAPPTPERRLIKLKRRKTNSGDGVNVKVEPETEQPAQPLEMINVKQEPEDKYGSGATLGQQRQQIMTPFCWTARGMKA